MVCIPAELFESVGGRGGEERNTKSDRMRNKGKRNETERDEQVVREIFVLPLKATYSHGHIHN